jgi:hypothetical protein
VALELIKDSEELRARGMIPENATVSLVHGMLDSQKKKVKHAWVEIENRVVDHSNNQNINEIVDDYYTANSALPVRRFTRAEADALLGALKARDGELPIYYWGDLSDQAILEATTNYRKSKSIFASGVTFSDPLNSANHDNLTINGGKCEDG